MYSDYLVILLFILIVFLIVFVFRGKSFRKIIALTLSALLCVAVIFILLDLGFAYLERNHATIPLSSKEKNLIKEFKRECNCDVAWEHNYELIKHANTKDSSANISFTWYTGREYRHYNPADDIYLKDSITIIQHANNVANKLLSTMSYKNYYHQLIIYYGHVDVVRSAHGDDLYHDHYKSVQYDIYSDGSLSISKTALKGL
ncbi:MAG: hypothetical protein JSS96_07845 [Bacteroidetes bacterium]|nr:hypothetical protein [Bacteroidota bacterium]